MKISLAQWSLHRRIESGTLRGLDFPRFASATFGIHAVELVNTLLESSDGSAVRSLREQSEGDDVEIPLLMVDDAGDLSSTDESERERAVQSHRRWIDFAAAVGSHAVRVNTGADESVRWNTPINAEPVTRAIDACTRSCEQLCDHAEPRGISVLLENHGGLSSNIPALVEVATRLGGREFGTLPDFGNCAPDADPYENVRRMMPFARAVSAKCHDFDDEGRETSVDFSRMLGIVNEAGYDGWIGIEYEGERLDEIDGVRACQRLLERLLS